MQFFPTRRSSDLVSRQKLAKLLDQRKKEFQKFVESAELYATESKARSEALQHVESSNQVLILRLYDKTQHWGTFYRLDRDEDSGESAPVNPEKEYRRFAQDVGAGVGVLELAALLDRSEEHTSELQS